jgi:hypothetical protein
MKKIDKNYRFTQKELEAIRSLYVLGRRDWLTNDVIEAISARSDRIVNRNQAMTTLVHMKRTIGRYPKNVAKYLLELYPSPTRTKPTCIIDGRH